MKQDWMNQIKILPFLFIYFKLSLLEGQPRIWESYVTLSAFSGNKDLVIIEESLMLTDKPEDIPVCFSTAILFVEDRE